MTGEIALNATSNGLTALATMPSFTPILAFCVFISIGVTLFLVVKNFRRLVYGISISIPTLGLVWISWLIAKPASTGNWKPLLILGGAIGGSIICILIGMVVEKTKLGKKLEKSLVSENG